MFCQHTRNVVIDNDYLIGVAKPLGCKDANSCRPAAHTHPFFLFVLYNRWLSCLDGQGSSPINRHLNSFFVAEREHCLASGITFFFSAPRQMTDPAQSQHLRAILGCRNMSNLFAANTNSSRFRTNIAISVDFDFYTTVTKHPLRNDCNHVDTLMLGRNNKWCWLVIWVCRCRANTRNKSR